MIPVYTDLRKIRCDSVCVVCGRLSVEGWGDEVGMDGVLGALRNIEVVYGRLQCLYFNNSDDYYSKS
jgi:hypothetical protein